MTRFTITTVLCLLLGASGIFASESTPQVTEGRTPDGQGGGEFVFEARADELSEERRQQIRSRIQENVARLRTEGLLPRRGVPATHPTLIWPMRPSATFTHYGYHGISGFVDQDPLFPDSLLDYACGDRTYDLAEGYNHQGVDFFLWPHSWLKMDNSDVEIVAAAAGTIVFKEDGNFDRNCGFGFGDWNAVYVQHADDSIAWYGHMKSGSLTVKAVGAAVAQGEYLGIVGSSGNSTGPHLHLELYDSEGNLNEAYQGTCNAMNATSWWASQRPYYDSAVNHIATLSAAPVFPDCPDAETPNEQSVFNPGDPIYFTTYFRDQLWSQVVQYTIYRPDGSVWTSWNHSSDDIYPASYWYWWWTSFASGGPSGIWRFEAVYEGRTYTKYFSLGANAGSARIPGQQGEAVPLTLDLAGSQVVLNWADSCISTDVDYAVYEGTLGAWYNHAPRSCTTAGATTLTLAPGAGDQYFLVVPTDTISEGSYGWRSSPVTERPVGSAACLSQQVAGCP